MDREAGMLWFIGPQRVGHNSATELMVFPVVTYGYESWTIEKPECQRSDAFQTEVLEKTLESPLDCRDPTSPS